MGAGPLHRGQPGGPRRRPEHVAENVAAGLELSPDEVTAITKNA
ncbi:MAG TPA: hypothetical protein VJ418_16860 [Streptosporangiaceae bacterium]|nr:hypothetical protein [Streptosporangiaceae bacterium]